MKKQQQHHQNNDNDNDNDHEALCHLIQWDPQNPPQYNPYDTVILYPTADAMYVDDPHLPLENIKRVIVIESTWGKGNSVVSHDALHGLQKIRIRDRESTYWRYQELGKQYLSTLEAIYYTCVEIIGQQQQQQQQHNIMNGSESQRRSESASLYDGSVDDLLFFYAYQHKMIVERYQQEEQHVKGFKPPKSWKPPIVT